MKCKQSEEYFAALGGCVCDRCFNKKTGPTPLGRFIRFFYSWSLWWRARRHHPMDFTDCPPNCELCAYKTAKTKPTKMLRLPLPKARLVSDYQLPSPTPPVIPPGEVYVQEVIGFEQRSNSLILHTVLVRRSPFGLPTLCKRCGHMDKTHFNTYGNGSCEFENCMCEGFET